ncbi:SIS domain-containing protein [Paenibacillaceae bacterium]|nr:SIS domain-containing protein [Paenibacillaceae bacterium]
MKVHGSLTYPEISSQHEAIRQTLEQLAVQQEWVDSYLKNDKYDEIIFIGSGSSYYQALTMAATYRKWTGKRASAHPSCDLFLFHEATVTSSGSSLIVGVSRSGESSEVLLAIESVAGLPNFDVCGITCHESSRLAKLADCLYSPLGKEESTVMTRSLSSMTFLMQAAIAQASGNEQLLAELQQTAALSERNVAEADSFISSFVTKHDLQKVIYLGMGAYYGLALEACLKVKEMAYIWTESFNTLEFRHGPKSIVEPGTLVCLLVSEHARSYELKVAEEMKAYGATVLLIVAAAGEDTAFADAVYEVGGTSLSDEARAVLYLPPLQYFGYYTALKRQVDPDHPRNLTQVVII